MTAVTRAPAELGVEAGEDPGRGRPVAVRLDDPAQHGDGRARRDRLGAARPPAPAAAPSPPAALTTMRPSSSEAAAREPIPARSRNSCGSRSQPPRPTTIVPSPATVSSLTRPSRMWTKRSAIAVEAGSWLTITTVQPSAAASSAIAS